MDIRITARHFDLSPELRDYAENRIATLTRYFERIIDAHLILTVEKHRNRAELSIGVYGQTLVAHAETNDMYISIDETCSKIERRLKRYSARFTEHRHLSEEEKTEMAERISQQVDSPEE